MIRVLQCVNNMHRAGLETMLMNYYRHIDRTKIQFDFLVHRQERADYDDEIEALGGRIFRAPKLMPWNYPAYFALMKQFFREHPEYKIVHSHIDSMSYLPLLAAKRAGVPIRIAHSHNTFIDWDYKYFLKQYFRYQLLSVATHCMACGEEAGKFLFRGASFSVLPNAIDMEKFYFDPSIRERKRKELGVADSFVVGHVGRFSAQKNHEFLITVFDALSRKKEDTILLLVGTGEKESQIREQVARHGLEDKVFFLGSRNDVAELYQAMDVFVLPSLFEGVPLVGIEAQTSGLPCVFSNKVPKEVEVTDSCSFLPLEMSLEKWIEVIANGVEADRTEIGKQDKQQNYNIINAVNQIESFYFSLNDFLLRT